MATRIPSGYNTVAMNNQANFRLNAPGPQALDTAQLAQQSTSSYAKPSSYFIPSRIDAPNPYYAQQQQMQQQMMVNALRNRRV